MSTKKFQIRAALRAHLVSIEDLPEVAWENNKVFTPPTEDGEPQPYLREKLFIADEFLSANDELTGIGIYRLDLFVPIGYSISATENLADQIKRKFKPAQVIGGNALKIERARVGDGQEEAPWYFVPIQIDFRAHQTNTEPA